MSSAGRFGLRLADLPPHRNVVSVRDVFVDRVPLVGGALTSYPAALPPRLHPDGAGRNASLFILMKLLVHTARPLPGICVCVLLVLTLGL